MIHDPVCPSRHLTNRDRCDKCQIIGWARKDEREAIREAVEKLPCGKESLDVLRSEVLHAIDSLKEKR